MTTYRNNYHLSPESLDEMEIFDMCRKAGIRTDFENGTHIFAYLTGKFNGQAVRIKTELTNATKAQLLKVIA